MKLSHQIKRSSLIRILNDVSGASLIEYSVLLGVVLAVTVGAIVLVGNKVNNSYNTVQNAINQ